MIQYKIRLIKKIKIRLCQPSYEKVDVIMGVNPLVSSESRYESIYGKKRRII